MKMHGIVISGFGTLFFVSSHVIIRKLLYYKGCIGNQILSEASIYLMSCRLVSAVQGIIASTAGIIITSSCNDIIKDTHWLTNAYVYFGMPYFLYDMWAMYSYHVRVNDHLYENLDKFQRIKMFVYKNALMVAHHLLLPSILLPLVLMYREDKGDFFFGAFFMIEMVVPFISAREILLQLNMKHTRLYFYTSLSMIVMFFICRLAAFPYLYYKYAQYAGISFFDVPYVIPKKCNFSCLLILAPQVYWFILMIKGLHRAVYKIQQ